jgi:hypothetical protein
VKRLVDVVPAESNTTMSGKDRTHKGACEMKKLIVLACVLAVMGSAEMASAKSKVQVKIPRPQLLSMSDVQLVREPVSLQGATYPTLAPGAEVPPAPGGATSAGPTPAPIQLFQCVKYKDLHHISPCAVPKLVKIVDPCWKPDPCSCCQQCAPCVYVKICVPPCGCERVKVSRHGHKVRYDYGKYAVDVVSKNGKIYVDYDD